MATPAQQQNTAAALARYRQLTERLHQDGWALAHADAVAALEAAAAIIETSLRPVPELAEADLLALTQRVSGLKPGESQSKQRWVYREGAPVSRSVNLLGGVRVWLGGDHNLAAVEIDPAEARRVERAFGFVGVGSDAPDVAENHDIYL